MDFRNLKFEYFDKVNGDVIIHNEGVGVKLTHLPTGIFILHDESDARYKNRVGAVIRLKATLEDSDND
jgi:protein subunit release factor A